MNIVKFQFLVFVIATAALATSPDGSGLGEAETGQETPHSIKSLDQLFVEIEQIEYQYNLDQERLKELQRNLESKDIKKEDVPILENYVAQFQERIQLMGKELEALKKERNRIEKMELSEEQILRALALELDESSLINEFAEFRPEESESRFGRVSDERAEDLEHDFAALLNSMQTRLGEERENQRIASETIVDAERNIEILVKMKEASSQHFERRFLLHQEMQTTYEQIMQIRPDLGYLFQPPPPPRDLDVYRKTFDRIQNE
jgi:hypothetical protein